ncbi:orotate phosphoribosyltransferase [Bartonella sp. DGB2]|uniref:orotate phosphoribosyltransferase n=1 Tax=Bartonella sp. DGB2 TaxID=3388426 RepID=UPI00398FBA6F
MKTEDVMAIFEQAGAILRGHFILTSGRHSALYLQKAKVFMHATLTERLCCALAKKIQAELTHSIDYLVGPAIGGLIPCYETSRHMGVPSLWVERENGHFRLRRFEITQGAKVVIIEDIVTTGVSIRETIVAMESSGAQVIAAACIMDRSGGKAEVGVPLIALAQYEVPSFAADEVPEDLAKLPAVKPGSRGL